MLERANFVLVDGSGWRLCMADIDERPLILDLAPGPSHAASVLSRGSREHLLDGWNPDDWAAAGALVDVPRRELLWFSNELGSGLAYRRACLALLARTWPGWRVRWAHDGQGDLVRHLEIPVATVRSAWLPPAERYLEPGCVVPSPEARTSGLMDTLLTVQPADGPATAWAVDVDDLHPLALAGSGVLEVVPGLGPGLVELPGPPPDSGLHLDLRRRAMRWWSVESTPGTDAALPERWPGWTIEPWRDPPWFDGYEQQLSACHGAIRGAAVDLGPAFDRLAGELGVDGPAHPLAGALAVARAARTGL
jgi:hypothetical protein